jgi:5-methylcytosine-specific restriction endonuclease McrA
MHTNTPLSPTHLKKLTPQELIQRTRSAAANERALQAEVIRLLAEIDRRRLYASLGYRSLFDFCVKELHYSESAAWRRIAAMRVLTDLPSAEEKLVTGELNLKTLTSLQTFFATEERHNKKTFTLEQKKQIMESVENKSGREADAILASLSPIPHSPFERERPLNELDVEIRFVADVPLLGKLHRLKDLNSHRDPSRSYKGLFTWLSDLGLKTFDPLTKAEKTAAPRIPTERTRPDRYVPADLKLKIWKRDQGKCTYIDPGSGRRCGATSFIEIDHIVPHALGGETTLENLRLYCRTHNLEAARKTYGDQKIQSEIRASQRQSH